MATQNITALLEKLRPVNPGQNVLTVASAGRMNAIQDLLRALAQGENIHKGANVFKRTGPGWVMLSAGRLPPAPEETTAEVCPFDVTIATSATAPMTMVDVTLVPGTVNSLLPSNIFDTTTLSNSGTFHVKLVVATDGETVTSASIVIDGTPVGTQSPTAFSLPVSYEVTLAVIKNGVAYRTIGCGSVTLTGSLQFTVEKDPPAEPGLPTMTEYYNWVLFAPAAE